MVTYGDDSDCVSFLWRLMMLVIADLANDADAGIVYNNDYGFLR